jgi:hypothetical protein
MATFTEEIQDLAPALDAEPVFERPAEGRWEQQQQPRELYAPEAGPGSGAWAGGDSRYDAPEAAGAAFLDPGSHALLQHVLPPLETGGFPTGAISGASADLDAPIFGGGGGGGGGGKPKGGGGAGGMWD